MKQLYFDKVLPQGFVALFAAKSLNLIASGLLGIFLPIFLYTLFDNNIYAVLAWHGCASLLSLCITPIGIKMLNKIGFKASLQISSIIGVIYYSLYYFVQSATNPVPLLGIAVITLVLWRLFYWLPYHIAFTELSESDSRAKQVSLFRTIREFASATAPVFAGFILLLDSGFSILFVTAMMLYAVSIIPYQYIKASHEKFEWKYVETWRNLFARKNRQIVIPFMAVGAESVAGVLIWPIFIYEVLKGNFFEVGLITTLIVSVTMLAQLTLGKYLDENNASSLVLKYGITLNSFGWVIKAFVVTSMHIFITGVYHSFVKIFTMTPLWTMLYEIGSDQGHYIDEYTVLHNMAQHVGRLFMILMAALMLIFIPIQWTFFVAAMASLTFNLISSGRLSLTKTG